MTAQRSALRQLYPHLMVGATAVGLGALVASGMSEAAFAILLASALVWAFGSWPAHTVLLFAASRPVAASFVYLSVAGIGVGQIWSLALLGICAGYLLVDSLAGEAVRPSIAAAPVVLVVLYGVFAVLPGDWSAGMTFLVRLVSWVLLAHCVRLMVAKGGDPDRVVAAGYVLAAGTIAAMLFASFNGLYGFGYYSGPTSEYSRTLTQGPHALASMGVLSLPFAIFRSVHGRQRFLALSVAVMLSAGVVLSLVRTTILALIVIWVVYFAWQLRFSAMSAGARIGVLVLGAVAGLRFVWDDLLVRFSDFSLFLGGGGSAMYAGSGRLAIWSAAVSESSSSVIRFVGGLGAGATNAAVQRSIGQSLWAHNDFVELFVSGGLLTLGAFVVFLVWMHSASWSLWRSNAVEADHRILGLLVWAACLAYVVMAAFNGIVFQQAAIPMAIAMGLVSGLGDRAASRRVGLAGA